MRTDDFAEFAATESDPDRLWDAATRWLDWRGFNKVLHLNIGVDRSVVTRTTLGRDFEVHYVEQRFDRHDPFMTYCLPSSRAVPTGADYLNLHAYLSTKEKQVILCASEAGFRSGFSLVTRRDGGICEAWNLGSSLGRAEFEQVSRENRLELRLGLMALRGRLAGGVENPLSPREAQCMRLLADGLRTKAIARELGIAEVTVELHLRHARGKLGAATREQAVAAFVSRGSAFVAGPPVQAGPQNLATTRA